MRVNAARTGDLFPDTLPEPPIARRRDPQTSKRAAVEYTVSGNRQNHKELILGIVREFPGSTCQEIARILRDRDLVSLGTELPTTTKRTSDLIREGRITTGEARRCSISGKQARPYYARG